MKKILKMAGVQLSPSPDRDKNLAYAASLVELSSKEGAKVAVLPQLFSLRWFPAGINKKNIELAEEEDGPTVNFLKKLAAKTLTVIIAPVFEKDGDDFYNTAFVIGADGKVTGKYRKIHVPQIPLWEERAYFKPGNLGFPVFETEFCKIGVQICWDVFFPEGFRVLALKGAEVVFAPTASAFYHSRLRWENAILSSAHSNGIFIFRVNRVGKEGRQEFYGRSFCAGPFGEFAGKPSGSSVGVVLAEIDLRETAEARKEWVFLKDRRPEEYKEITEPKK